MSDKEEKVWRRPLRTAQHHHESRYRIIVAFLDNPNQLQSEVGRKLGLAIGPKDGCSAVSNCIKTCERELGTKLFDRIECRQGKRRWIEYKARPHDPIAAAMYVLARVLVERR